MTSNIEIWFESDEREILPYICSEKRSSLAREIDMIENDGGWVDKQGAVRELLDFKKKDDSEQENNLKIIV